MSEPKKPNTRRPAVKKTPAINAESGVAKEAEIRTFKSGGLPEIAHGEFSNPVGAIADVAFFSGIFPGETPATLALRILVGRSLGLNDMQGLFDLDIEAPATVRYRLAGRTFEQAADDVDRLAPGTALFTQVTETAASPEPGSNVVQMPARDVAEDDKTAPIAIASQKIDDSANKGPSLKPEGEGPLDILPGAGDTSAATIPASAAVIDDDQDMRSTFEQADTAAAVSDVSGDTVRLWRKGIVDMCEELGINPAEKTATFDAKPVPERRKMFDDCRAYYVGKVQEARQYVLARLIEDGKADVDSQKGFFLYAEVGFDPMKWTFTEAKKAENAISEFLKSKGTRPAA